MTNPILLTHDALVDLSINDCNRAVIEVARSVASGDRPVTDLSKVIKAMDLIHQATSVFGSVLDDTDLGEGPRLKQVG